jgi:hypothetical protein
VLFSLSLPGIMQRGMGDAVIAQTCRDEIGITKVNASRAQAVSLIFPDVYLSQAIL